MPDKHSVFGMVYGDINKEGFEKLHLNYCACKPGLEGEFRLGVTFVLVG